MTSDTVVERAVMAVTGLGGVMDRVLCEVGIPVVCDGFRRQEITGRFLHDLLRDLLDERGQFVERLDAACDLLRELTEKPEEQVGDLELERRWHVAMGANADE